MGRMWALAPDLEVSRIGLGAWQFGTERWGYGSDFTREDAIAAVHASLEAGVNWIDTAEVYGDGESERIIAEALGERIRDVVIATKVAGSHLRYGDVLKAAEGSLRRLRRDWIDLYQLHWPNSYVPLEETLKALEELLASGKIRYVGVSNFPPELTEPLRQALGERLVSNQVRYSLADRSIEKHILPYARRHGITIIAYSPLGQGLLTGKYTRDNLPQDPIRGEHPLFRSPNVDRIFEVVAVLQELARKYERTPAQIALRWLIQQDGVVAIPGAKNAGQARDNAAAMDFSLEPEDWVRLSEVSRYEITYFTE